MADFDLKRILFALLDHGVDFVVIGAEAAILQGAPLDATLDVDVAASHSERNLRKLAAALRELAAELRVPDPEEHVAIPLDAPMLKQMSVLTLMTRFGPLDILFDPAGAPPYTEMRKSASEINAFGVLVRVASLADIVSMKRAAGREKDAAHLIKILVYMREFER
ncbi:MAG: hypothetical protein QOG54_739 [Actinomycetota bacterium]|nr:hypothetical protein [Actinomycetota bacterium]